MKPFISSSASSKRQEEKYLVSKMMMSRILTKLECFPIYPARTVSSIYFDTPTLTHFSDGEEGSVPRTKYRFRWYGDPEQIPEYGNFEIKKTYEHHREKLSKKIALSDLNLQSENLVDETGQRLEPVCQIIYQRAYWENLKKTRLTYDFNIRVKPIRSASQHHISHEILEVKYGHDTPSFDIASILGNHKTRFSKYGFAINQIFSIPK